jgi:hypothetical protein
MLQVDHLINHILLLSQIQHYKPNNNQAKQNSSNPIIDTLQKLNPLK